MTENGVHRWSVSGILAPASLHQRPQFLIALFRRWLLRSKSLADAQNGSHLVKLVERRVARAHLRHGEQSSESLEFVTHVVAEACKGIDIVGGRAPAMSFDDALGRHPCSAAVPKSRGCHAASSVISYDNEAEVA
jgi:hypothetical protein